LLGAIVVSVVSFMLSLFVRGADHGRDRNR
jgi:hypothetical protein